MTENKIGQIPDFTPDVETETEEVKETELDVEPGEKETPAEPPAESEQSEQKPALDNKGDDTGDVSKAVARATEGLRKEISTLRRELAEAKGADRKVIQSKIDKVQEKVDELADVAPEDVSLIDRVLRAKGYMTKEESSKMHYDAVKNEEVTKFLDKFPEYKPENDPNDVNWAALQRQIQSWYRMPDDPRAVGELLLKAHRDITKTSSDRGTVEAKKQQVKIASSGSSGAQRSPSNNTKATLTSAQKEHLRSGGWSDEEIKKIEQNLPE